MYSIKIIAPFFIALHCVTYSMENRLVICRDVISNIVLQLSQIVGTPSLVNKKDIPVIAKYVKALSLTNKFFYNAINDKNISYKLVESIISRFTITYVDVINELKIPGVCKYFGNYSKTDTYGPKMFAIEPKILLEEGNKKEIRSCITSVKTAPKECVMLLKQLNKQPMQYSLRHQPGEYLLTKCKCKVLPLESQTDCRIITILCSSVKKGWSVDSIGCGCTSFYIINNIERGISKWKDKTKKYCTIGKLKKQFTELLNQLTTGWKRVGLIQYPDIFHKESEEEWYLYIKTERLNAEVALMGLFASSFKLEEDISCNNIWHCPGIGYEYRDRLYLWIKKKSFENVVQKLGLQFE